MTKCGAIARLAAAARSASFRNGVIPPRRGASGWAISRARALINGEGAEGGSNFDADYPPKWVNIACRLTATHSVGTSFLRGLWGNPWEYESPPSASSQYAKGIWRIGSITIPTVGLTTIILCRGTWR